MAVTAMGGHDLVDRCVGEAVGVARKEGATAFEVRPHPTQALADQRMQARIDERDAPVLHVARQHSHIVAATLEHEVVRQPLLVLEEVLLDVAGAVAEAEHEIVVPLVGVVLHDVPQDGPRADRHERLRHAVVELVHPHPLSAAEQYDLHHPLLEDRCRGDRHDELPAPFVDVGELGADLVVEVPREDQHVVGTCPVELLDGEHGHVHAGAEAAVLVRVAIDDEVDEVLTDAAVVEHRHALAGGAVPDDLLAGLLRVDQELEQRALGGLDLFVEPLVCRRIRVPECDLASVELCAPRGSTRLRLVSSTWPA